MSKRKPVDGLAIGIGIGPAPLSIETVAISSLKAHPANPRKHPDRSIEAVARSIEAFGWTNPVLVSADGLILAGHTRIKAAQSRGMTEVPIIRLPLSGAAADAYLVADNQTATLSEWDMPKLTDILSELDAHGFDATLTGFDEDELAKLLTADPGEADIGQLGDVDFQVVVSCPGEHAQASLCTELEARGLKCRLLTL